MALSNSLEIKRDWAAQSTRKHLKGQSSYRCPGCGLSPSSASSYSSSKSISSSASSRPSSSSSSSSSSKSASSSSSSSASRSPTSASSASSAARSNPNSPRPLDADEPPLPDIVTALRLEKNRWKIEDGGPKTETTLPSAPSLLRAKSFSDRSPRACACAAGSTAA